jgi:DNA-sulfur modification-associated
MAIKLKKESALNLVLEGSIGSFSVGNGQDKQNSIEVKYFLTHVGLDFSNGSNEALLSHLAPVREIFDVNNLDFDEIMQRDIDDARVSSDLIPYLLDDKSVDLVKLFPPVVVVILPVKEGENRPDNLYPEVSEEETQENQEEQGSFILRSGSVGQEVFQFEQPILDGKRLKHDLVRLRLNTHKTRLVIVDGQHRAMALLALYRNLMDQWSDEKRAPFREYYSEWTSQYIQQFNLKEINLPIILCTFPTLDSKYVGDCDLKKASRSVFLTLNKNARKVSNSRNILLDDNDLVAYFLRRSLADIKQKDLYDKSSLRIHNVELDQFGDKLKLQNPIAVTGVSHLYYIIEHLLLNTDSDVNGVKPRSGNFTKRTNLTSYLCFDRLNGRNILGANIANSTSRDVFTLDAAGKLGEVFDDKYSKLIIMMFEKFELYEHHTSEILKLKKRIQENTDRQLLPILFDGQGMSRVFERHRQNLKDRLKNDSNSKVPEILAIVDRLDATSKRLEESVNEFRKNRATLFVSKISELKIDSKALPEIIKWVNDLYENILSSGQFKSEAQHLLLV